MTARPIGLEELLAVAALQTRVDRKYLLPAQDLDLIELADPDLRVLTIAGRTDHGYASRYLDTPTLDAFELAAHARPRRFKVRERTYLDSGEQFLEVKTRSRRGETIKDRLPLAGATRAEVARFAPAMVRERTGNELAALHPTLEVTYSRTTYLLPASASRVTVDTDLTWTSLLTPEHTRDGASRLPATLTLPGWVVVETKTDGRPCALDALLWRRGIRPIRLSKYTCGLALTTPSLSLPTNRWHSTRTRLASSAVVPVAANAA